MCSTLPCAANSLRAVWRCRHPRPPTPQLTLTPTLNQP